MTYLFPYAGSERKKERVVIRSLKPKTEVVAPPPPAKEDIRPIELPVMPAVLREILLEVCRLHNVHPNDVAGTKHSAQLVYARRHYIVRARNETPHSFPRIARAIRKDHTTAIQAYRRWETEGDKMIDVWRPSPPGMRRKVGPYELTPSEHSVMELVAQGMSFKEIADLRKNCLKTVRNTYNSGLRKQELRQGACGELV